ncbi:hypothetical protein ET475_05600 [Microbacterium protaetiae]|uniref:Uncharacterized protein n=1 Tax=Microbacterium protaetiae TaxID=2509458 RepID=A0A4P6EBF8_9MICO|nr:hypothetical protein [Microbacterium protaetiae]QAY59512.1 hypothetical protein ET475_05600 [Microbacterium protaetiae]
MPQRSATRSMPPTPVVLVVWIVSLLAGTALGAWLLGMITPMDEDPVSALILGGFVGVFAGLVAAAGITGGMIMAGAWGIIPGIGVGIALFGLVATSFAPGPWAVVGVAGFIVAIIGFYAAGLSSGYTPPTVVTLFGSPLTAVAGVVFIVVGILGDNLMLLVIGIGCLAAAGTILGFRLVHRRRVRDEPPASR